MIVLYMNLFEPLQILTQTFRQSTPLIITGGDQLKTSKIGLHFRKISFKLAAFQNGKIYQKSKKLVERRSTSSPNLVHILSPPISEKMGLQIRL